MRSRVTDFLCTECGLCCDGSLFSDVELSSSKEACRLENFGVDVEEDDDEERSLLLQPCSALQGKRCGIYRYRPKCCRTFECRLLKSVLAEQVTLEEARAKIAVLTGEVAALRELMSRFSAGSNLPLKEQFFEAVTAVAEQHSNSQAEDSTELVRRMRRVEETIEKIFLK